MSKFFIENNVHVSGDAWFAVEHFFVCENYKMGRIFAFSIWLEFTC